MTATDELLRHGNQIIADLHAAIRASKRARRACPECGGNPDQAVDQACQTCAVEGDKEVTTPWAP